jgi:DNA-binding MarR family transcriptional regulator
MANEIHSVGRLLLLAAREFSAQVCAKLRENEHPDLKSGHALLVANWDVEGTRISTLAERAEITKQAMGVWVKEMETLGYCRKGRRPARCTRDSGSSDRKRAPTFG